MTDLEVFYVVADVVLISLLFINAVILSEIENNTWDSKYWLERDYKAKFGYTECWKI